MSTDTIRIGTGPFTKFSSFLGFELEMVDLCDLCRTLAYRQPESTGLQSDGNRREGGQSKIRHNMCSFILMFVPTRSHPIFVLPSPLVSGHPIRFGVNYVRAIERIESPAQR